MHAGSQIADNGHYSFTFDRKVKLIAGQNDIVLLSVTVGLPVSSLYS